MNHFALRLIATILILPCVVSSIIGQLLNSTVSGDYYIIAENRISIFLPVAPKHREIKNDTFGTIQQYSATSSKDKTSYFLMYLPVFDTTKYNGEEDILQNGPRPNLGELTKANILKTTKIEYRGHPAMDIEMDLPGGHASAERRVIVIHNRVYDLLAVFPKGQPNKEMNEKFFNTFSVKD
jgi:hypothetical protein